MKILIVAATWAEISPLLKEYNAKEKKRNLFSFLLGKNKVDVLITGVGIANTAFILGKIFATNKYDFAINAGIAGSFRKDFPLGIVVNVVSDCFADFGAENKTRFLTAEEMGLVKKRELWLKGSFIKHNIIQSLPKVKGITVNTVHRNEVNIVKVKRKFNPDVESMEGAAFFRACNEEKIRCVQLRVISNYVEMRNKKNWRIKEAITNLNKIFLEILENMAENICIERYFIPFTLFMVSCLFY